MEPLPYLASSARYAEATAFSALPDAPVVETAARPARAARTRTHVAAVLRRLADVVAPVPAPRPRRACVGTR